MRVIPWLPFFAATSASAFTVSSRKVTESVILDEVLAQMRGARDRSGPDRWNVRRGLRL